MSNLKFIKDTSTYIFEKIWNADLILNMICKLYDMRIKHDLPICWKIIGGCFRFKKCRNKFLPV